jgi:hypothetical protein
VFKGLFDAASYMDLRRLPELASARPPRADAYPVALAASMGRRHAAHASAILAGARIRTGPQRNPVARAKTSSLLEEVTLRNLRLGTTADLMLRRHNNDVSHPVLRNEGQIRIAAVY